MSAPNSQYHHGHEGVVNLQVPNLPASPSYPSHPPISFSSCCQPALPNMISLSSDPRTDAQPQGPLSAPTWPYSHLPTPQSPNYLARYVGDQPQTPQSPLHDIQHPSGAVTTSYQRLTRSTEETPTKSNNNSLRQCMTPESSPPYVSSSPLRMGFAAMPFVTSATRNSSVDTPDTLTSKNFHMPPSALGPTTLAPSPHISSPVSAVSENSSHLSSPFIAKLSMAERAERGTKRKRALSVSTTSVPTNVNDVFSSPLTNAVVRSRLIDSDLTNNSTLPASPSPPTSTSSTVGELDRIRQVLIQDHLAQIQDAENRRPEYSKGTKRPFSDLNSMDEGERERGGSTAGVIENTNNGRRLKLFRETSEESFEESLMAGGYGCYRTHDSVHQPQPVSLMGSNTARILDTAGTFVQHVGEEAPPTEKESKKRRRLEAFHRNCRLGTKLTPIAIKGKGRMLLELPEEGKAAIGSKSSRKRSAGNKRKKRRTERAPSRDKALDQGAALDVPNWPDDEFPWKVRKEELGEADKALEEERLQWIEKFLDRDTDDEDDGERRTCFGASDDEILPSAKWGHVYERVADKPIPVRMGRGKMVPLLAHPEDVRRAYVKKKSVFPSDPSDARAALLAKRNVRALAYRNQRRQQEMAMEDDDDVVCICNGRDDGRELVQCDDCQTWYHLQCIGIRSIAELGREEDAWFCRSCMTRSPSPARAAFPVVHQEPTFVPTDDAPRVWQTQDPTLYQPLHTSPLWNAPRIPKTPTRGGGYSDFDLSSSSDSARLPSTPQNGCHDIRLYHSPGSSDHAPPSTSRRRCHDNDDDPPFDPNSTPSRGIKFGAFGTPKSNPWSIRAGGGGLLLHTPSRHHSRGSFGGRSIGSLGEDGEGCDGLTGYPNVEDSPVRRSGPKDIFASPLLARPLRIWET